MVATSDLAKIDLFEGISEDKLSGVAAKFQEQEIKAGEQLFCEGCEADEFYILLEGNINLSMKLTSRPETLVLGVINKFGQSFGWSVVVSAKHYTATAEAKEDSKILTIKAVDMLDFLDQDCETGYAISRRMTEIVSSRLRYYRVLLKTF